MAKTRATIAVSFLWICLSATAQTAKVEAIGALTDASVPEPIRQALDLKGSRVLVDANTIAAEIWLRKALPARPKKETPDVLYDRISESTLVGVLHFPQTSTDYRGQAIPAGFYTLRYALIPNDGNHLGVAPSRDFLLMIPANVDPSPDKVLTFAELLALSRQASRTKHPAPLSMVLAEAATAPGVSKDDEDHYIFSAGIKLASGEDMPIAVVVKGTVQQ